MADSPPDPPVEGGRRQGPLPGWVWIGLVVVVAAGALGAAWWFGREDTSALSTPPTDPEAFCVATAELQGVGDITVTVGEGSGGLSDAAASLRAMAAAGPPDQIVEDLDSLAAAFDAVVAEIAALPPGDPTNLDRVSALLDEQLQALEESSDRVDDYRRRWCPDDPSTTTTGAPSTTTGPAGP